MGEIVNLREARKRREKAARDAQAAENRTRFGRTTGEKQEDQRERERRTALLDQSKLDPPSESGDA